MHFQSRICVTMHNSNPIGICISFICRSALEATKELKYWLHVMDLGFEL